MYSLVIVPKPVRYLFRHWQWKMWEEEGNTVCRHCYWGGGDTNNLYTSPLGEEGIQTVYRHCYWGRRGYKQSIDIAIGGGGDTNSL